MDHAVREAPFVEQLQRQADVLGQRLRAAANHDGREDEVALVHQHDRGLEPAQRSGGPVQDEGQRQPAPPIGSGFAGAFPGQLSPDGSHVTFVSDSGVGIGFDVWVADIDGTNAMELTSFDGFFFDPSWNPAGTKIVFSVYVAATSSLEVFTVNANGGTPKADHRLTRDRRIPARVVAQREVDRGLRQQRQRSRLQLRPVPVSI